MCERPLSADGFTGPVRLLRQRLTVAQLQTLSILAGGAMGALARAGVGQALPPRPGAWPWATFAVNVAGAFVLAWLTTRLSEMVAPTRYWRLLLGTGFCGAFDDVFHVPGRDDTPRSRRVRRPRTGLRHRQHRGGDGGGGRRDRPGAEAPLRMIGVLVWIGVGAMGAAGAYARFSVAAAITARRPGAFPWGTFVVNLSRASRSAS